MPNRNIYPALTAQTVGSGTNLLTTSPIQVGGSILTFTLENTGGSALATLVLLGKAQSGDLAFQTLVSGTNWVSTHPLVIQSTALATTASNTAGFAMVRVHGMTQLEFTATTTAGTNTTTLNINPVFTDPA